MTSLKQQISLIPFYRARRVCMLVTTIIMAFYLYNIDWSTVFCHRPPHPFCSVHVECTANFEVCQIHLSLHLPAVLWPLSTGKTGSFHVYFLYFYLKVVLRNHVNCDSVLPRSVSYGTSCNYALMTLIFDRDIQRDCAPVESDIGLRENEIKHEQRIIDANDLDAFYRFVNKRISNRSCVGAIAMDDDTILTDNRNRVNGFNTYFLSDSVPDNGFIPCCRPVSLPAILDSVTFNEAFLSAGPDGLPPMLFNKFRYCLSKPLAVLFNQLLSVGYVPCEWLNAVIVPVLQRGTAGKLCNYRPISLTCVYEKNIVL